MAEKTIEQLQTENDNLQAEVDLLKEQVVNLETENAEMKAAVSSKDTEIKALSVKAQHSSKVVTAEHEGKVYQVLGGTQLSLDGEPQKLSAADIAATPEVLAKLVEMDSGLLKEVR